MGLPIVAGDDVPPTGFVSTETTLETGVRETGHQPVRNTPAGIERRVVAEQGASARERQCEERSVVDRRRQRQMCIRDSL